VNRLHQWLCRSNGWAHLMQTRLLPWMLDGARLGARVLEIGPGPGAVSDLLPDRVEHLTCVEIDRRLAAALARRVGGRNVAVLCQDATAMSFPHATFDAVVGVMMLHHVPSAALQDRLFGEVARVLRPGGVFVGIESVYSHALRLLHLFDTMVLVDPDTLPTRLRRAGFADAQIDLKSHAFRFVARRRCSEK
jgi:SAM-dependent methyltransferase